MANLITRAGADRVLTVDLHAGQIQGFFDIPTDNLFGAPTMVRDIQAHHNGSKNVMVVSPDVGGVVRARALAKRLDAPLAIVDKRRDRAGESEVMNVIGDIAGRNCVLLDDIVDSGGTLCNAADALLDGGAASVSAYITHGVLSGGAVARVAASKLSELVLDRHHSADRSGAGRAQHPRDLDRAFDRRGDRPHRQGRKRLFAVQLAPAPTCGNCVLTAIPRVLRPEIRISLLTAFDVRRGLQSRGPTGLASVPPRPLRRWRSRKGATTLDTQVAGGPTRPAG